MNNFSNNTNTWLIREPENIDFLVDTRCRHTARKEEIFNACMTTARTKRTELGRDLSNEEAQQLYKDHVNAYRRKQYIERKAS